MGNINRNVKRKYFAHEAETISLLPNQWGYAADTKRIVVMESDGVTRRFYYDSTYVSDVLEGAIGTLSEATVVETIENLTGITNPDTVRSVFVKGYSFEGDGGGGWFYWDAESEDATDYGTIFIPDSNPETGRWIRIYDNAVSVKWFGATGDGVTDDTDAIQRASDFSIVDVPDGTYLITDVITLHSDLILSGHGKNRSILKCPAGTQLPEAFFIGYSLENVMIKDLGFDNSENYPDENTTSGNLEEYYLGDTPYSPSNGAIKFRNGAENIEIKDCYFHGITGMSIQFLQHPTLFYHKIRITGNNFVDGAYIRKVISIEGGDNGGGEVESNCSTDIIIDGNFINKHGPQKYTMPGIIFRNASCDAISLVHCARFTVANNQIEYSAGSGIRIERSLYGQVIGNTTSETAESGINVYSDSQHIIVANNTVKAWGRIPNLGYLRKYNPGSGMKYYMAREYADGVTVTLPADPTATPWISECPYDLSAVDLSNVPLWSDGNYYDDNTPFTDLTDGGDISNAANFTVPSWMGILPYRGCGGISVHQKSRRVIVANNRITGDTTQVGGKYTHASDFGISTVHTTNLPVAYDSPMIAYGNIIQNVITDFIYQPRYVDPINERGAISGVVVYHGNHKINPSNARIEELPGSYDINIGSSTARYIKFISNSVVKYELDATDLHHFYSAAQIDGALQVKGNITAGSSTHNSDTSIIIDAIGGGTRSKDIVYRDGGVDNVILRLSTGGNFQARMYNDSGTFIDNAFSIERASGGTMFLNRSITLARSIQNKKGANVASANDLTLGSDGNTFSITGTTTINGIKTDIWQAGSEITLIFSGALTVTHNGSPTSGWAKILLAGSVNLTTAANTILRLVYDGAQWQEISRKAA